MTIDEMIEVLQAYKAGKKIQFKTKLHERWSDFAVETGPSWSFDCYDYRVKPEPREIWASKESLYRAFSGANVIVAYVQPTEGEIRFREVLDPEAQ